MLGGDSSKIFSAGLPNIKGSITAWHGTSGLVSPQSIASGALYCAEPAGSQGIVHANDNGARNPLGFDASRSNAIYGGSETVQPPAFALIPQIKF